MLRLRKTLISAGTFNVKCLKVLADIDVLAGRRATPLIGPRPSSPPILGRSSHSVRLINEHGQNAVINNFQNDANVKLPEKVQMAIEQLDRYGMRADTVAPFFYRHYLRVWPQTPPPLWGADDRFWTAFALVFALALGTVTMLMVYAALFFYNDPAATSLGRGVLVAQFILWSIVGVIGAAASVVTRQGMMREAKSLDLPPWERFSSSWRPSLTQVNELVTPQQFWLHSLWGNRPFKSGIVAGWAIFGVIWLALPQRVLEIGAAVTFAYILLCILSMSLTSRNVRGPANATFWSGLHGTMYGMVDLAVIAAGFRMVFHRQESLDGFAPIVLVMALICVFFHAYEWVIFSRQRRLAQRVQQVEQARLLADARLHALKAQIEPHFVFNTIAHLKSMIATEPQNATRMADELSDFLRASLHALREDSTTVEAEMVLCRAYLEIARLRFGERLSIAIDVASDAEAIKIPPLMLLTLLENAIQHGVEPKETASRVAVSAAVSEIGGVRFLALRVTDDGVGFGGSAVGGAGVGLANVRERLASTYGDAASLTLTANQPSGVCAEIRVPIAMVKS
jgi:Histidine kinase